MHIEIKRVKKPNEKVPIPEELNIEKLKSSISLNSKINIPPPIPQRFKEKYVNVRLMKFLSKLKNTSVDISLLRLS